MYNNETRDRVRDKQDRILELAERLHLDDYLQLSDAFPGSPRIRQLHGIIFPEWEAAIDEALRSLEMRTTPTPSAPLADTCDLCDEPVARDLAFCSTACSIRHYGTMPLPPHMSHAAREAYPMRCNRCHRPMAGTTAYDGACACGGLIEAAPRDPRTHAEREAAQRADEAEQAIDGWLRADCHRARQCDRCGSWPQWGWWRDGTVFCNACHGDAPDALTRYDRTPPVHLTEPPTPLQPGCRCVACIPTARADEAELQAGLLATLPPMAGGRGPVPRRERPNEPYIVAELIPWKGPRYHAGVTTRRAGVVTCLSLRNEHYRTARVWRVFTRRQFIKANGEWGDEENTPPPPMAGGAPSHYTDPAWYADEAWHLQEERNAESAQEEEPREPERFYGHSHQCPACGAIWPHFAGKREQCPQPNEYACLRCREDRSATGATDIYALQRYSEPPSGQVWCRHLIQHDPSPPTAHTHPCPTCHQARPCTATGCADGSRECNTCSQCRGW